MPLQGESLEQAREQKAYQAASELDEAILKFDDSDVLERAIRYMSQNTRNSLLRAIELAKKNGL